MKKIRSGWNSITYRMVAMLILLILPFNIVSLVITVFSIQDARQKTISSIENMAALTMQQLDSRLATMNDFFYNLDQNQSDFQLYKQQGERTGQLAMAEVGLADYFNSFVENDAFADVLFWISENYDRTYLGMKSLENENGGRSVERKTELREFLETDEKSSYNRWGIVNIGDMQWLLKTYVQNDLYYGSMISLDEVENTLKKSLSFSGVEIVFGSMEQEKNTPEGKLTVESVSEKGRFWMQIHVPVSEVYASLSVVQILCIGFAFLYVLLIPILIYLIHRMVIYPLKNIGQAMENLKRGDQDYRMPVGNASEEFEAINETFNDMADRIQELKIANYEKELERQRIELRNLQLQIRPHFLMNMFNLLFSFAQIENYQSIQKLAVYLSEYFRYIFQSGKELQSFSMELDLITKYLDIAALRYPDCFEVVYEIDPEVLEVEVPPLMIHNFVENVFKHIVNYDKKIHLRIEAFTDEKESTFLITDDGPGMPEGMAEEINQGIFRKREKERVHVGIENSWKRLQYFYNGKGSLTVESEPGQGTCFTILIPLGGKRE